MYIAIYEYIIYMILHIFKLAINSKISNNVICLAKWQITCTATKKRLPRDSLFGLERWRASHTYCLTLRFFDSTHLPEYQGVGINAS